MVTLFVRHRVADYAAWRAVYDAFGANLMGLGVSAEAVYQGADDPNDVTVTHDFASLEAGRAFAANPDLKQAMAGAGVEGAPSMWFTTRA